MIIILPIRHAHHIRIPIAILKHRRKRLTQTIRLAILAANLIIDIKLHLSSLILLTIRLIHAGWILSQRRSIRRGLHLLHLTSIVHLLLAIVIVITTISIVRPVLLIISIIMRVEMMMMVMCLMVPIKMVVMSASIIP